MEAASDLRKAAIDRLQAGETWDLVVIGGGATGLGTALDAAARGYRVALIEARDFAQGTSSRSTKLVHGGVRYLANGQLGLVREALDERGRLLQLAPHIVHRLDFLVPARRWWERGYYTLGLTAYDLLAGGSRLGRSRPLGRAEALKRIPTLRQEGLRGGVVYADGQFDDSRLAIALARTALGHGAVLLNHAPAESLVQQDGRLCGVVARDAETGVSLRMSARAVVNATGVFVDQIRALDDALARPLVRPSRGSHLVVDRRFLPGETALLVPKTDDGRVLFAIPWHGKALIGTTDLATDEVAVEPEASEDEVDYMLAHAARYLDPAPTRRDVLSRFSGLRPLVDPTGASSGGTARVSREHFVEVAGSGLITITGGKWTTYRRMAADAVDHAITVGGLAPRPCGTAELRLQSRPGGDCSAWPAYGGDGHELAAVLAERPQLAARIHDRLPYSEAEVVWAVRGEWARRLDDVLARRLRATVLDAGAALEAAPRVARVIAAELGRPPDWEAAELSRFQSLALTWR